MVTLCTPELFPLLLGVSSHVHMVYEEPTTVSVQPRGTFHIDSIVTMLYLQVCSKRGTLICGR